MSQHRDEIPVLKDETNPSQAAKQRDKAKVREKAAERSEDLAQGQIVIVSARWILVIAGLVLTLWAPDKIGTLRIQLMVLLILAVANFYLHAQLLMRKRR